MKKVVLSFNWFCDVESAELLNHIGKKAEVPPSVASVFFCCALKQPCQGDCIANEPMILIERIPPSKSESNQKPITKVNCNKLIQHDTTIPHVC